MKTTRKNRTAASVLTDIRKRLEGLQVALRQSESEVRIWKAQIAIIQSILDDDEKDGSDDAE